MKQLRKRILDLIVTLLAVKIKYSEAISNMKAIDTCLLLDAKKQKNLQALEICRLFKIDKEEVLADSKIFLEKLRSQSSVNGIIFRYENYLKELYEEILSEGSMNAFQTLVLTNHLKNEDILLKKIA